MGAEEDRLVFDPASADFWRRFKADYWEQQPVAMVVPEPLFEVADIFAAVVAMPSRGPSDRFWLAASEQPKTPEDFRQLSLDVFGPKASDGGFEGFFARMGENGYGINIHSLGSGNPSLIPAKESFARNLAAVPGRATPLGWHIDTFFGNYLATPFGIHSDAASVFSFVLQGQRRYYTWPPECFAPGDPALMTPDLDVIAAQVPRAEVFEVGPGECFYWPSNRWHLVGSDGQPFVAAQIFTTFDEGQLEHLRSG